MTDEIVICEASDLERLKELDGEIESLRFHNFEGVFRSKEYEISSINHIRFTGTLKGSFFFTDCSIKHVREESLNSEIDTFIFMRCSIDFFDIYSNAKIRELNFFMCKSLGDISVINGQINLLLFLYNRQIHGLHLDARIETIYIDLFINEKTGASFDEISRDTLKIPTLGYLLIGKLPSGSISVRNGCIGDISLNLSGESLSLSLLSIRCRRLVLENVKRNQLSIDKVVIDPDILFDALKAGFSDRFKMIVFELPTVT